MSQPAEFIPPCRTNTTLVIIAGGEGRRMGGQEKGLLELAGKPLLRHILDKMAPQTERILINANNKLSEYDQFGVPVFSDNPGLEPGPLRGILAAFANTDSPWILTVPCDTPRLPGNLANRLFDAIGESRHLLAVPHDGKRLQSLCLLIHRHLQPQLSDFFLQGGRAIKDWINRTPHVVVDFHHEAAGFINLNTLIELEQAESGLL